MNCILSEVIQGKVLYKKTGDPGETEITRLGLV